MHSPIYESVVDGTDIAPILANLELASEGAPRHHLIIALISMLLIVSYPDMSPEQLKAGVRDVSRFICLIMDAPPVEGADPKLTLN